MKYTPVLAAAVVAAMLLSGYDAPAPKPVPTCSAGEPMIQTTLYFGLNRHAGPAITATEWQAFINWQVTPRIKDGLSVFDAKGQWLGNDGKLASENSKALVLCYAPDKESEEEGKIEALRSNYK